MLSRNSFTSVSQRWESTKVRGHARGKERRGQERATKGVNVGTAYGMYVWNVITKTLTSCNF